MKSYLYKILLIAVCFLASCMKNDIPYPYVELSITKVEGTGFTASIDNNSRVVTLTLDETTNIKTVEITTVEITNGATSSKVLTGTFDMRMPIETVLSLYNDFSWTITAEQEITRYFTVEGQIGQTTFNEQDRTAIVYVSNSRDLTNINVTSLKLGPEGITTYAPVDFVGIQDFSYSSLRKVYITYHGDEYEWKLYVYPIEASVTLDMCEAWTKVVWLGASGDLSSGSYGFKYKRSADADYTEVASEDITVNGGYFSASVDNLEPEESYVFYAYAGDKESATETVTMGTEDQLPNSDMENWSMDSSNKYDVPYASGASEFWSSGNQGASSVGYVLTTPVRDTPSASTGTYSAQLKSQNVVVKFAAGNLFLGTYVGTYDTTHGVIGFGRPFTQRPRKLKLWVKYTTDKIDKIPSSVDGQFSTDDDDIGIVYAALGTWDAATYGKDSEGVVRGTADVPVIIDTRSTATFSLFKSTDAMIAYGEKEFGVNDNNWAEIEIDLDYNNYKTQPTHIILVCSASKYGDYFVGSTSSTMWVDDIELIY